MTYISGANLTFNTTYVNGSGKCVKLGPFAVVIFKLKIIADMGRITMASVPSDFKPSSLQNPILFEYRTPEGDEYYYNNISPIASNGDIVQGISASIRTGSTFRGVYIYAL